MRGKLVIALDQGSVGHQAMFWLCTKVRLQGFWVHDPWHRIWNDLRAALVGAGLWAVVLELIAAMNARSGPWSNSAFPRT